MKKKVENLVDEGFRIGLVETAFFDGKFEIILDVIKVNTNLSIGGLG